MLVCPEGLFSETLKLFELINNKNLINDKLNFLFRVHPVLNKSIDFKNKLINKNIKFSSQKDIESDFKKSDVILYSGSSVCVQAVMQGIIPIYYRSPSCEFSRDPLYEVNRFTIKNKIELELKLNSLLKNKSTLSFKHKMYNLEKYCGLYFTKFNHNVLFKVLNKTKN